MNPYHTFLGLPESEIKPDHYLLLGLVRFESDPALIHAAAVQRNMQLRSWDNSTQWREANRLLDDVVAAAAILEDPTRRAAYDDQLRVDLGIRPKTFHSANRDATPVNWNRIWWVIGGAVISGAATIAIALNLSQRKPALTADTQPIPGATIPDSATEPIPVQIVEEDTTNPAAIDPGVPATIPTPPTIQQEAEKLEPPVVPSKELFPASVQYLSGSGIVLAQDPDQTWVRLPYRSKMRLGGTFAVLEPFEANLDIDRGALMVTVLGNSSCRLLPPDKSTTVGLEVNQGRLVFQSSSSNAAEIPLLSIKLGDETWTLQLLSGDTICSIEIVPLEPRQFEQSLGPDWYSGVLRVHAGRVNWSSAGVPQQIESRMALALPQRVVPAQELSSEVDWIDASARNQSPRRRFASVFERQFNLDRSAEGALQEAMSSSNAAMAELGVHGMCLIGSITGMLDALASTDSDDGRLAAIDGLRKWLGRYPGHGPELKSMLEKQYKESDFLYTLLWGLQPEDGTIPRTCQELVGGLRNPRIEVRELAHFWVVRLSGRKWDYRASDSKPKREIAVRRIQNHLLARNGVFQPAR